MQAGTRRTTLSCGARLERGTTDTGGSHGQGEQNYLQFALVPDRVPSVWCTTERTRVLRQVTHVFKGIHIGTHGRSGNSGYTRMLLVGEVVPTAVALRASGGGWGAQCGRFSAGPLLASHLSPS